MQNNDVKHHISVVIATYNGARFIAEQLNSIISQTVKPDRIIICDDGSTDDTVEIIAGFGHAETIWVHVNKEKLGVIGNFKKAVSLTPDHGIIAFCDQDDVWEHNKLEVLTSLLESSTDRNKPGMVFSDFSIIDSRGVQIRPSLWEEFAVFPEKQTFKTLLLRNIVPGCSMVINEQMRDEFLMIPEEAYMHDAWITFLAYLYNNIACTGEPLVRYRQHDHNVTYSLNAISKKGKFQKLFEYLKGMMFDRDFLKKELRMAEAFCSRYKLLMSAQQLKDFEEFLALKNRNFLFKKIHIHQVNKLEIVGGQR